ncbi:hypothetical protein Tcan_04086 [Toxocara canis]|uniref:Uncharacterized protein n=1 Tax=Toxocara canis TaxID=6265 RepID=A0A0B2W3C9_TOXCA|nr:hypothetical protein Tcan_04086 [Toxocara canis]
MPDAASLLTLRTTKPVVRNSWEPRIGRKLETLKSDTSLSRALESSSSSKKSSAPMIPVNDANLQQQTEKKASDEENVKWKRRTQIIYDVERMGM